MKKELAVTIVLVLALLYACVFVVSDWHASLPLVIFYGVLIINTYFSIALFSQIIPKRNVTQNIVDFFLMIIYLALVLIINIPLLFMFLLMLLFIVATLKYGLLLGVVNQPRLLRRKILVDLAGSLACALTLGGFIAVGESLSTWIFTIIFIIANFILFFIYPLYRLDA